MAENRTNIVVIDARADQPNSRGNPSYITNISAWFRVRGSRFRVEDPEYRDAENSSWGNSDAHLRQLLIKKINHQAVGEGKIRPIEKPVQSGWIPVGEWLGSSGLGFRAPGSGLRRKPTAKTAKVAKKNLSVNEGKGLFGDPGDLAADSAIGLAKNRENKKPKSKVQNAK